MAPSTIDTAAPVVDQFHKKAAVNDAAEESVTNGAVSNGQTEELHSGASKTPLRLSGVLDQFKSFDVTPVIGKEFPTAHLAEWLRAPNSDELLRDLAITGLETLILHLWPSSSLDDTLLIFG